MKLKQLILLGVLALSGSAMPVLGTSVDNWYCDGYKAGYTAGFEQTSGQTPTRLSPLCPLKPFDVPEDQKSQFDAGYDRGLRDGIRAGSRG